MSRRFASLVGIVVACSLLLTSLPAFGADWDAFPELEGRQHVAIKKRFDGPLYDELRSCYRDFDSRVGAEYFAAMVDVTAESGSRSRKHTDAGPYADALFDAWHEQGKLDTKDDVLIVFGLHNRSLAIRPADKWKKIGFEGAVVDETIAASHFAKYRGRAKYVDALCSLLDDVDLRLSSLQREMNARITQLNERLPRLEEQLNALIERVEARSQGAQPYSEELLSRLAAAQTKFDAAKELVEDEPTEAVRLADEVRAVLAPVRSDLARFNEDMARLDTIEAELAALASQIHERPDRDWEEPQAALGQLEVCEDMATAVRQDYEGRPWQVRDCQRAAQAHLARADVHYFYLRELLPALAIGLLLLLVAGLLILRRRRRQRALRQLEPALAEWRRRIVQASQCLEKLAAQCPAYFAPERARWQGESAALDEEVAEATNRMSILVAEGRELAERAGALQDASHALDAKRLDEALSLLRETPVVLPAGELDPRQHLAVPLAETYSTTSNRLLSDLDDTYRQIRQRLDELVQLEARLAESTVSAEEAAQEAIEAVAKRRALGVAAEHLTGPLESGLEAGAQAKRLSRVDPVRASDMLEQTTRRLDEISEHAQSGNEAVQCVQGTLAELGEELNQRIRQLRFARVALDKLSFDPRHEFDAAKREAVRIIELVSQAREEQAAEALGQLRMGMQKLAHKLEVVATARERVPRQITQLDARSKDLKHRLLEMRFTLRLVVSEGNSPVFEAESKKLGQYHARLNALGKHFARIEEHHAAGRYYLASEKLGRVEQLFEAAEALLTELEHVKDDVGQARDHCLSLVEVCEPMLRHLQARSKRPQVCATLRELVAEQAVTFQIVRDQVRAEQAHWLDAHDELIALHKALTFLEAEIEADLRGEVGAEAEREYRETQVELITYRASRRGGVLSPTTLGSNSSWADSVATIDEAADAV